MRSVLITGINGLLGANCAEQFLQNGYSVRGLVRPQADLLSLEGLDVDLVAGRVDQRADLLTAMQDIKYVVHAAANTKQWSSSFSDYDININGTRAVIHACLEAGIERLVHVGTANSFGFGQVDNPADEQSRFEDFQHHSVYMRSKRQAHDLVLRAVREQDLPAVIVNPTNMLGPRDAKPSSGIIILLALQRHVGRFNITPQTPTILNFIHARDAACGVLAAMEKGRIAESYILGNQSLSYAELFDAIESILEIKLHRLMVPAWLIGIMGWFGDLSERMKGRPLPLNRINARSLITGRYFSSAKAIEELQLPQTDLNIALVDALVWFRDHGYLHPHLVLKASQLVPGVTPG